MDSNNISSSNMGDGNHGEFIHHSSQSSQNTITAFLAKLWALVNDTSCDDLISWDPSGGSFHVYDQARFSREILPRYFKHNNFASFIRQLNMYGFRKISNIEHGSLKNERDDIEFAHPHFIRGQESLLELIKRRAPETQQRSNTQGGINPSSALVATDYLDSKSGRSMEYLHLLDDVRSLQTKQTSLSDKLSYMQTENQALWTEIGTLRQKHSKQQQIVSKLMEFLLHFISTNPQHSHDESVEQPTSNDVPITDVNHPQKGQGQHQINNSSLVANDQGLSPNTLKRKHSALMHGDESNKRTPMQQQQQQQQFSHPPNLGRQQSVTINELADNDTTVWHHTTNTPPLIDFVPSPPQSTHSTDDNYQQQPHDYRWTTSSNELINPNVHDQKNNNFQAVGNGDKAGNAYVPDFFLRTDNTNDTNSNIGQANGGKSIGLKTSGTNPTQQVQLPPLLKQELIELPNNNPIVNRGQSPTLYSQNQQQHKIGETNSQLSFNLDDITGDVDHIQSSLDNIRDLMFDNLPDGTSIDDLFGADNELLLPLLQAVSTDGQTPNLLLENINDQNLTTGENQPENLSTTTNSQSVPNVSNHLLEQLITETAKLEEQQNAINQLVRDKSDLQDKIHILEQQNTISQLEREKSDLEDKVHILEKQTAKRQ
ncbi:unnamed protein product [Adineta steineri]|uniref:HSF-type DNA-binding domain-containing protein n=1 Tax=Adineta steineri TaxID=433720 RepID=A0A818VKL3_9BILA|nr:unnamed protein product [Adineta steineri]CAF3710810.1 unnamed protein product [Adineta steineri]